MKIGYDSKRLFCNFTGLGNYSRTLVKNVRIYFPFHEYHLYTPKVIESDETVAFIDEVKYKLHVSTAVVKSVWRSYSMVKQLKKDDIELYHGLSNELPFRIHKAGVKSVVTIHDLIFKVYPSTYSYFDRKMYDVKFKNACQNADKIIAISENTKRDIVKFYGIDVNKIEVVYQSVNPLYFQEESESRQNKVFDANNIPEEYFIYVGSVQERKNLKLVVEAYKFLGSHVQFPLVVIGKGKKYKQEVIELIAKYKLESMFIWVDVSEDNYSLKCLYQNAKALIFPSFYEGFGLPIAEALLCKTPVITAGVSSLPEAGGPNSIYIDPNNHKQLAEVMLRVLSDKEMVSKMKENGYSYAIQNFTAESTSKQIIAVYNAVMEK